MAHQKLLAASALAALCAATALALPPARAAGQQAMVTVRDAQTGQLRAPTAAEAAALHGKPGLLRQAPAQRVELAGPGGGGKVQLGKSALVYSVVTRAPDGKLAQQCVSGKPAAHAAMAHPTPAKEFRDETE